MGLIGCRTDHNFGGVNIKYQSQASRYRNSSLLFSGSCPRTWCSLDDHGYPGEPDECQRATVGKTLDFMLPEHRDESAVSGFFARAIEKHGWPQKVVIDKSAANLAGLQNLNILLALYGCFWLSEILQVNISII